MRQLSHGQITAKNFSRFDINGFRFRTATLEKTRPLAATSNSRVLITAADANEKELDYYGILQNIIEYTFGGDKLLKVVSFDCIWFDPIHGTRVDDFEMVEVKHGSRISGRDSNLVLAHQVVQVYYLSYPHPNLKAWWVAYKVNPQLHPQRYVAYLESNEVDDVECVYQEESGGNNFAGVSNGVAIEELATSTMDLMREKPRPSKKGLRQSKRIKEMK